MSHYLAFDFGAESGRALLGSLSGGKLVLPGRPGLGLTAANRG
jgi:hypothetical protein